MSREQDQFNFIVPLSLELCRERILSLKRPWKLFSNHQRRVHVKQLDENSYKFHLYDNIGRNLSVVANGIITAQTEETTHVLGSVAISTTVKVIVGIILLIHTLVGIGFASEGAIHVLFLFPLASYILTGVFWHMLIRRKQSLKQQLYEALTEQDKIKPKRGKIDLNAGDMY